LLNVTSRPGEGAGHVLNVLGVLDGRRQPVVDHDGNDALPGQHPAEAAVRSEEHTSELQSPCNLVCRLLLEKKKKKKTHITLNKSKNFHLATPTLTDNIKFNSNSASTIASLPLIAW